MKRLLLVNDCANVMYDLAPHLSKYYEVKRIVRSRGIWSKTFGLAFKVLFSHADIYHANYALQDAYLVDKFKSLDVLHAHGSDIRLGLKSKWKRVVRSNLKHAKIVLYSTPDMKALLNGFRSDSKYLPTPVDTNLFSLKEDLKDAHALKAIYFQKPYEQFSNQLHTLLNAHGISLDVMTERVPYESMPALLKKYDIFIDQTSIDALSKTCLEAMSCGLSTIDFRHKNDFRVELERIAGTNGLGKGNREYVMKNHDSKIVAEKLVSIYGELT